MPGTKFLYMIPLIKNEGKENNIKKRLKCFLVSKALPQSSKNFLVLTKQTMTDKKLYKYRFYKCFSLFCRFVIDTQLSSRIHTLTTSFSKTIISRRQSLIDLLVNSVKLCRDLRKQTFCNLMLLYTFQIYVLYVSLLFLCMIIS